MKLNAANLLAAISDFEYKLARWERDRAKLESKELTDENRDKTEALKKAQTMAINNTKALLSKLLNIQEQYHKAKKKGTQMSEGDQQILKHLGFTETTISTKSPGSPTSAGSGKTSESVKPRSISVSSSNSSTSTTSISNHSTPRSPLIFHSSPNNLPKSPSFDGRKSATLNSLEAISRSTEQPPVVSPKSPSTDMHSSVLSSIKKEKDQNDLAFDSTAGRALLTFSPEKNEQKSDQLKIELKQQQLENSTLKEMNTKQRSELNSIKLERSQLLHEKQQLLNQTTQLETQLNQSSTNIKDANLVKSMLVEMQNEAQQLESQWQKSLEFERDRLRKEQEKHLSHLQGQIKQQKLQIEMQQQELDIKNNELENINHSISRNQLNGTAQISTMKEQIKSLDSQLAEYQNDNELLIQENERMRQLANDTDSLINSLRTQIESLKHQFSNQDTNSKLHHEDNFLQQSMTLVHSLVQKENLLLRNLITELKNEHKNKENIGAQLEKEFESIFKDRSYLPDNLMKVFPNEIEFEEQKNQFESVLNNISNEEPHIYKPTDPHDPLDIKVADTLNELAKSRRFPSGLRFRITRLAQGEYFIDKKVRLRNFQGHIVIREGMDYVKLGQYLFKLYQPFLHPVSFKSDVSSKLPSQPVEDNPEPIEHKQPSRKSTPVKHQPSPPSKPKMSTSPRSNSRISSPAKRSTSTTKKRSKSRSNERMLSTSSYSKRYKLSKSPSVKGPKLSTAQRSKSRTQQSKKKKIKKSPTRMSAGAIRAARSHSRTRKPHEDQDPSPSKQSMSYIRQRLSQDTSSMNASELRQFKKIALRNQIEQMRKRQQH